MSKVRDVWIEVGPPPGEEEFDLLVERLAELSGIPRADLDDWLEERFEEDD